MVPPGQPRDEGLYSIWCADPRGADAARAWNELYARHIDALTVYCKRLTADWATAEDCAEEALIRLMQARDIGGSFRAYLYRAARNLAIDAIRRRKHVLTLAEQPEPQASASPPGNVEEFADLVRCMEKIEPKCRELVVLRACHGFTFADAKRITGIARAISSLKSMYDKTLETLRRCLEKK